MSINAKGKTFYCDYGTSIVAVRCGSDHEVVEQFNLNDSGKFLAENMCKLLNREADALKAKARAEVRKEVVKACEDEVAKLPVGGNIDTRCWLEAIIGRIRQAATGAVPRSMTLESSVEKAKARYAEKYGADSWQWRDKGLTFAIGDFLSSCEMTESDLDFAKREGIVAEVNWWLNQQDEGR